MDQSDPVGTAFGILFTIGFMALLAYAVHWRAKHRPRYITDEHGERQRVIRWNRGQPVYNPKTWQQRVHEEAILASKRRWAILLSAPFVAAPVGVIYASQNADSVAGSSLWGAALYPVIVYGSIPFAFIFFLPNFLKELLYQSGYQGMDGAKVLDKQPKAQPGREVVEAQKAHGDAQLASEAEAVALLTSNKK